MEADSQADPERRTTLVFESELGDVRPRKPLPRIWTVFVAYFAAFAGSVLVQIIAGIFLVVWLLAHGADVKQLTSDLQAMLSTPQGFIALASMSQLAIGLAAFIPARLSTEPTRLRLGLVAPGLPAWAYPIIAIGSLPPLALGIALAVALARVITPDPGVQHLYEQMTWAWAVPFVIFIALVPGFVEETFFRGYLQRRLLERWSPAVAILVTTTLFAIMHIMPHAVVNAFVIGLWLGVLAWRTGSVWPSVVSHAFINGSWNVWQTGKMLGVFSPVPQVGVTVTISVLAIGCFLASIWLLVRRPLQTGGTTASD